MLRKALLKKSRAFLLSVLVFSLMVSTTVSSQGAGTLSFNSHAESQQSPYSASWTGTQSTTITTTAPRNHKKFGGLMRQTQGPILHEHSGPI